jgi:uncharacterized protein
MVLLRKWIFWFVGTIGLLYFLLVMLAYFFQEKIIFHPIQFDPAFRFSFPQAFEEVIIPVGNHVKLNGVLFKSQNPQGLIFYLHGNAGSVQSWGQIAQTYTQHNYDLFMLDYRGFGKSGGCINKEEILFSDVLTAYDTLRTKYPEGKIIVSGYSIGTGMASYVASVRNPQMLILHAPYYSLSDLQKSLFPILPSFLLRYKIRTDLFIQKCTMPIVIFHGTNDAVIYHQSSNKLKQLKSQNVQLIKLENESHGGITTNAIYLTMLDSILNK